MIGYSHDSSVLMVIDTRQIKKTNILLTQSKVVLDDSPWKMFSVFEKEFNIFEQKRVISYDIPDWQKKEGVPLKNREYASIYLRSEDSTRVYTRRTYDLLGFLGDIGGL